MNNNIITIFFTLLISHKLNICSYNILFHIIPIYYIQFIYLTSQLDIPYTNNYLYYCSYLKYFYFNININDNNQRRLLDIQSYIKNDEIKYKLILLLGYLFYFYIPLYTYYTI